MTSTATTSTVRSAATELPTAMPRWAWGYTAMPRWAWG